MRHDEQPDFYEILGVPRSAAPEEITRAYRKAMRAVHPDASGTTGLFRLVKTAHDTLKDPLARAAYDARPSSTPPDSAPPPPPPPPPPASPPPPPPPPPPPRPRRRRRWPWRTEEPVGPKAAAAAEEEEPSGDERGRAQEEPAVRIRPRFGAYRATVPVAAAWCVACLAAVYALWPERLPLDFGLLLLLPVVAAPIISTQPAIRSRTWPWVLCVAIFMPTAVLTTLDADQAVFWPLCLALAALLLAGAALAATPYVVRQGRDLDGLVDRESLGYQIFNIPGAGLTTAAAREMSRISADDIESLHSMAGTRIVHSLTPPQLPGQARCHVDHAVLRDNRLALIVVRRWPAATYAWTERGALLADGHRFPGGDTGIVASVRSMRSVLPRGTQVRGFVSVQPEDPLLTSWFEPAWASRSGAFAGSPAQVHDQLTEWLGEAEPVVRRRTFAAILPHVRRPDRT